LKNVPSFHLLVNQVSAANAPANQSTNLFLGKKKEPKNDFSFFGVKRSPKKLKLDSIALSKESRH
jgi:hypothetical protein